MSFNKKIDMLLKAKKLDKLSINKMEKALGLDGTIYKGVKDPDYIPNPDLVSEILRIYRIKKTWWETDWETGSLDMFEKNNTPVPDAADKDSKPIAMNEIYRDLIEKNSEYRLVPKVIMDAYEIQPKSVIEFNNARILELIEAKNDLIKDLKEEIAELKTRIATPSQQGQ